MSRRRLQILLTVLLLIGATWAAWELWLHRPMGDGPAGARFAADKFRGSWHEGRVVLVGLGDSVTAGFGASPGCSYFERLVQPAGRDSEEFKGGNLRSVFGRLEVTNLALSGSTLAQVLRAQLPRLGRHPVDVLGVVVVTAGGNDLIHNYGRSAPVDGAMFGATWEQAQPWLRAFEERVEALLRGIDEAFPGGCEIFLGNIYDPSDGTGSLQWVGLPAWPDGGRIHAHANGIVQRAAMRRANVHLVDLHAAFLGHGVTCRQFWRATFRREDPHWWYHENIEDPNDRGYDALRRLFLNAMADVFVARRSNPGTP